MPKKRGGVSWEVTMTGLFFAGVFGLLCLGSGVLIGRASRPQPACFPDAEVIGNSFLGRCQADSMKSKRRCKNPAVFGSPFCGRHGGLK
jgi:hypothetical protein